MRIRIRPVYKLIGCCFFVLSFLITRSAAAQIETDHYIIELSPPVPTTADLVTLIFTKKAGAPCWLTNNAISVDIINRVVDVSVYPLEAMFTGCQSPNIIRFVLGYMSEQGAYGLNVYEESGFQGVKSFNPDNVTVQDGFEVIRASVLVNPEVPQQGSVQSGVGVIRGWACDATRVEVQFDDYPLMQIAYGTSRDDTLVQCGDSNNGYGSVIAWGLLGYGTHTMTTFIDGVEKSAVTFEVTGLDEPFIQGLIGTYELADFPSPGESVTVEWSEADQNFIITDYRK